MNEKENLIKFLKDLISPYSNSSSEEEFEKNEGIKSSIYSLLGNEEIYIDSATELAYNNYSSYYDHSFFMRIKKNNFEIIQRISQVDYNSSQGGEEEEEEEVIVKITKEKAILVILGKTKKLEDDEENYNFSDLFQKDKA